MIKLAFELGGENIILRINGNDVRFSNASLGLNEFFPIDNIRLSYVGVVREFPDLETNDNWRKVAIGRFKDKIREFKKEDEIVDYIRKELEPHGYKLISKQKDGFRIERVRWVHLIIS